MSRRDRVIVHHTAASGHRLYRRSAENILRVNDPRRHRGSRTRGRPHDADALRRALVPKVHRLLRRWRRWDGAELCVRLATLQLVADNTPFSARLLAASNVAATLTAVGGTGTPSLDWLNGDVFGREGFGRLDDPYEEWFTESVPFFGGPYTILPGREGAVVPEATLARALAG